MSDSCGPGKGPCPADLARRMDEIVAHFKKLVRRFPPLACAFCGMRREFKEAIKENHHIAYHRTFKPPNPDLKICPAPIAPSPCNKLIRGDDIEELCKRFKELWQQLAQVMAERTQWKMENEKLKKKLAKLKAKYEPDYDVDPLEKNKRKRVKLRN